jgi:predicted kinase
MRERFVHHLLAIHSTPMPPSLIMFVGLPGAGKSEFATHLTALFLPSILTVVNQDTLKSRERVVQATRVALSSGISVVVDRTNIDAEQRQHWYDICTEVDVDCFIVHFTTPPDECITNCDQRDGHRTVKQGQGRKVVGSMVKAATTPVVGESAKIKRVFVIRGIGYSADYEAVVKFLRELLA